MAGFYRKRGRQVVVYYYDRTTKKQKDLPRAQTAHLDSLPDPDIKRWVEEWEVGGGVGRVRSRQRSVASDETLAALLQSFLDEHRALRDAKAGTRRDLRHHIEFYAFEFFVRVRAERDVRRWWQHAPAFPMWLRTAYPSLRVTTVKKIIQSLQRFGEHLATHHVISQPWLLPLPSVRQRPQTPLVKALDPKAVLAAAEGLRAEQPRWALAVLLGYFASLRPEETYALTKGDFITGAKAKADTKTHARFAKQSLGSGLSVVVSKTKTRAGDEPLAKTHFAYGVVNVWSVEAARAVAALVRDLPDGPIWSERRYPLDRTCAEIVKPLLGVSAYDLRRASGLYLGREVGVEPFLLQDHFRHATITTTMLYTRRPLDERETDDTQDFDDVG